MLPSAAPDWFPRQEQVTADRAAAAWDAVCRRIVDDVRGISMEFVEGECAGDVVQHFAGRAWRCVERHWLRLGADRPLAFETVWERLQEGDLGFPKKQSNIVRDVVFACAVEFRHERAALMFDREYMPLVRDLARRAVGEQGVQLVENFAAELLLPRPGHTPRIATYEGQTAFLAWLRAVVVNHCLSAVRRQQSLPSGSIEAVDEAPAPAILPGAGPCGDLLRPLFRQAIGKLAAADRLLVRWLILDGVPQKQVAAGLRIHTGNVGKKREAAVQRIWGDISESINASASAGTLRDCLESIVAGDDPELRRGLAETLAEVWRAETPAAAWEGSP